jgi:DNA-binding transcriptional ArsR family regulator
MGMGAERVFKAMAEPSRLELLRLLQADGEQSVNDLTEKVDITQQAVSLHLKVLESAGLVQARREGTRSLYVVKPEGFRLACDFLASFWGDKLGALKKFAERQ